MVYNNTHKNVRARVYATTVLLERRSVRSLLRNVVILQQNHISHSIPDIHTNKMKYTLPCVCVLADSVECAGVRVAPRALSENLCYDLLPSCLSPRDTLAASTRLGLCAPTSTRDFTRPRCAHALPFASNTEHAVLTKTHPITTCTHASTHATLGDARRRN